MNNSSFSCGFSLFYWPWFAEEHKGIYDLYVDGDRFDYYKQSELYVKRSKYNNLKDEILSNTDNEVNGPKIWNENVVSKATQFMDTLKVKTIKFNKGYLSHWNKHFDIDDDKPITIHHIQSLIVYTDFSLLSTNFTKTFRKTYVSETLQSVKSRNAAYYHMARYFIETIQGYGYSEYETAAKGEVLFCGLSYQLFMPSFRIKLRGPTSTSTEIEIAQNFAKRQGIILQLTGEGERRFDVSWLSRYAEEQERVFVHGLKSMRLEAVRLINRRNIWVNYGTFCEIMFLINKACTGTGVEYEEKGSESQKRIDILDGLFNNDRSIPIYMQKCFNLFRYNLQTLEIDFRYIDGYPNYIKNIMLHNYEKMDKVYDCKDPWSYFVELTGNTNIIQRKLIELFPNLTKLCIDCGSYQQWRFSMVGLIESLLSVNQRQQLQIEIMAQWIDEDGDENGINRSWLFYCWYNISKWSELLIDGVETSQTVKQYFDQNKDKDWNEKDKISPTYTSLLSINQNNIKFDIKQTVKHGMSGEYRNDLLSIKL